MTPGVATRSGPAHAKRNPEPAGGNAPCRHTTKSGGRPAPPKYRATCDRTERFPSRSDFRRTEIGPSKQLTRRTPGGSRPAVPTLRQDGRNAVRPTPAPAKTAAVPRTARQTDRTRFSDRRQADDMRTSGNATIHSPRRPTEDSPDSETPQKKPARAIRQEITTTEYRNGGTHRHRRENRRRTAPRPQPRFGTFRSGEPPSRYRIPRKTEGHNKNSNQEQPITLPTPHRWPSTPVPHEKTSSGTGRVPRTEPSGKKRRGRRRNPDFRPPVAALGIRFGSRPSDAPHGRGIARSGASYRRLISFDPIKCPSA